MELLLLSHFKNIHVETNFYYEVADAISANSARPSGGKKTKRKEQMRDKKVRASDVAGIHSLGRAYVRGHIVDHLFVAWAKP